LPAISRQEALAAFHRQPEHLQKTQWSHHGGLNLELSRFCIDSGLSVALLNGETGDGYTALIRAVRSGSQELIALLLQAPGIDINAPGIDDRTALMHACTRSNADVVRQLLQVPGIAINHRSAFGITALMNAATIGNLAIINLLLNTPGIELNDVDHDGDSALSRAASFGEEQVVVRLLQQPGIDPNGGTPLVAAATFGAYGTLCRLLEAPGTDVNAIDLQGNTALIQAARTLYPRVNGQVIDYIQLDYSNYLLVIERLLSVTDINVGITDAGGERPLDIIHRSGYAEIANLLTRYHERSTAAASGAARDRRAVSL